MNKTSVILLLFGLFFLFIFGRFISINHNQNKLPQPLVTPVLSPRGRLTIGLDKKQPLSLVDPIEISLIASSGSYLIIGFDIDLRYDKHKLKYLSVKNLQSDDFDLYTKEIATGTIITGIKKLTVDKKITFNQTRLLTINFQPLMKGRITMNLAWQKGSKRESNLISIGSNDILDRVAGVSIEVGRAVSLTKGQLFSLDQSTKFTLIDVVPQKENCIDCVESALVQVETNGIQKRIQFKVGGFAGYLNDQFTVDSLRLVLKKTYLERIDLIIYEK